MKNLNKKNKKGESKMKKLTALMTKRELQREFNRLERKTTMSEGDYARMEEVEYELNIKYNY